MQRAIVRSCNSSFENVAPILQNCSLNAAPPSPTAAGIQGGYRRCGICRPSHSTKVPTPSSEVAATATSARPRVRGHHPHGHGRREYWRFSCPLPSAPAIDIPTSPPLPAAFSSPSAPPTSTSPPDCLPLQPPTPFSFFPSLFRVFLSSAPLTPCGRPAHSSPP